MFNIFEKLNYGYTVNSLVALKKGIKDYLIFIFVLFVYLEEVTDLEILQNKYDSVDTPTIKHNSING